MESIDISKWVRSALVIDDKWSEVKNLLHTLNSNGVSTCYYNPNPGEVLDSDEFIDHDWLESLNEEALEATTQTAQKAYEKTVQELSFASMKDLPADSLLVHNLVFLDIDFKKDEAPDFKSQVNYAVGMLKNALSTECSPYGVVLWSKESATPHEGKDGKEESSFEYIKNFFYGRAFSGKPKPLFVVDIEKDAWEESNYHKLISSINEKLLANKMARYFAYWETGVQSSSTDTYHFIQKMAERLAESEELNEIESSFLNLVKHATYMHFGFPRLNDDAIPKLLARYSFCYISHILYDKLTGQFSLRDINGIFSDGVDKLIKNEDVSSPVKKLHEEILKQFDSCNIKLKQDVLDSLSEAVDEVAKQEDGGVTAYDQMIAELNFLETFDSVKDDVELPGVIYRYNNRGETLIDITPPCDIANSKNDGRLYLEGKFYDHKNSLKKAKNNFNSPTKARIWKTPPVLYDGKYAVLEFCLTRVVKEKEEIYKPILRLKNSSFADLMQKFGNYNSRLGATNFKP
ncbi:hypothetical protein [Desulfovibrio aminophilus]|uniref:hypothetical protein n=1 Tax=Desulfovibrio aminophilus TaxID=81425 RepID=UPI003394EB6D